MRVLYWYFDRVAWTPAMRTLDDAPDPGPGELTETVGAFVHVEPGDGPAQQTKLVKNAKWLARKWEGNRVLLHSFTHLGEDKADPEAARAMLDGAKERLTDAGYEVYETPYGWFLDLDMQAPGRPLARIFKEF